MKPLVIAVISVFVISCAGNNKPNIKPSPSQASDRVEEFFKNYSEKKFDKMWDMLSPGMQAQNDKSEYIKDFEITAKIEGLKMIRYGKPRLSEKNHTQNIYIATFETDLVFYSKADNVRFSACSGTTWHWMPYLGNWYLAREDFLLEAKCAGVNSGS